MFALPAPSSIGWYISVPRNNPSMLEFLTEHEHTRASRKPSKKAKDHARILSRSCENSKSGARKHSTSITFFLSQAHSLIPSCGPHGGKQAHHFHHALLEIAHKGIYPTFTSISVVYCTYLCTIPFGTRYMHFCISK